MKKIAITTGDPAGIGPEVVGKGLRFRPLSPAIAYIVYGQMELPPGYKVIDVHDVAEGNFRDRNKIISIENPSQAKEGGKIYTIKISSNEIEKGKPSKASGGVALKILDRCVADIKQYGLEAILTAPVSKASIGHHRIFTGHTEYLAEQFHASDYIMNFVGDSFSLSLLTIHCSLKEVKDYISIDYLLPKMRLVYKFATKKYGRCRLALMSMNPHVGEDGLFGTEDEVLKKAVKILNEEGMLIDGPYPADSFFKYHIKDYKQVIAVYHDQGLIPFKMINRDTGVNTTLGLPIIRTSVDHGTAFDIAGKNMASPKSFISTLKLTEELLGETTETANQYTTFAHYYDDYMSHVDWDEWLQFILDNLPAGKAAMNLKVLDVACGTGLMADKLCKAGMIVEAIDSSEEMLTVAAQKDERINLVKASFNDPFPVDEYDMIVSLFDSVNYLQQEEEIAGFFNNTAQALKKDGAFIFDISTLFNCEENFDGCVYVNETEDSFLTVRTDFANGYQNLGIDLFVNNGLFWNHRDENHKLRIYPVKTIVELLKSVSGLKLISMHRLEGFEAINNMTAIDIDNQIERLFFVVKRF